MKKKELSALIFISLLASALFAYASGDPLTGQGFVGQEIDKLLEKLWIITTTHDFSNFLTRVYDNLPSFILANPDITTLKQVQGKMIGLVYPLFILCIVTTSAYILLYSESPRGRVKAKGVLIRLLFAMVIVSLSPYFTELLLLFCQSLAKAVLGMVAKENATTMTKVGATSLFILFGELTMIHRTGGIDLLLLWETFLLIFNFALAARYLIVTFWGMMLPISLLMYVFTPTKKIGKKFLHQTFLWSFVQVGWAFAVVLVAVSVATIDASLPGYPREKIGIACLMLMIGTPMAILGIMDWLSMGVEVIEIVNAAPLSIAALTIDEMKVERAVVTEEPALEGV